LSPPPREQLVIGTVVKQLLRICALTRRRCLKRMDTSSLSGVSDATCEKTSVANVCVGSGEEEGGREGGKEKGERERRKEGRRREGGRREGGREEGGSERASEREREVG
jgi:hypothetical protein